MLSRRRFLAFTLLGGACVASFSGWRLLRVGRRDDLLRSLLRSVLDLREGPELDACHSRARSLLSRMTRVQQLEIRAALEILERSPLVHIHSLRGFSQLEQDDQLKVLQAWIQGAPLMRPLVCGLKEFAALTFYSQDFAWKEIGYEGPWIVRR